MVQTRSAVRYILASHLACKEDDWEEIIGLAVDDAKSDKPAIRAEARRFLKSVLLPNDPVGMLAQFLTDLTFEQIRDRIRQMEEAKERIQQIPTLDVVPEEGVDHAERRDRRRDPEDEPEPHGASPFSSSS